MRAGVSDNGFTGREVGARRRLAPTEHAVNRRRGAEGELWQPRFFGRALRTVKESNEGVVGQFAVAALSERRNSLRIQDRRSETAATKIKLTHYQREGGIHSPKPGEGWFGQAPGRLAMVKLERMRRHQRQRIRQPTDGLIVDRVGMPSDARARI